MNENIIVKLVAINDFSVLLQLTELNCPYLQYTTTMYSVDKRALLVARFYLRAENESHSRRFLSLLLST